MKLLAALLLLAVGSAFAQTGTALTGEESGLSQRGGAG
jgi:hypothetical protein